MGVCQNERYAQILATEIAKRMPCPITGNLPTTLTKQSFIHLCTVHQYRHLRKNAWVGLLAERNNPCVACKLGKRIAAGKTIRAPKNVTFR